MNQDEMRHLRTISNISGAVKGSREEAQLILSGELSKLSPEAQKRLSDTQLDPKEQVILKTLQAIKASLESAARPRPYGPLPKIPAKRKPDKDSTALNKLIIKLTKKNLSIKDIETAAKKAFPKLVEDITSAAIRSRKSRLRKKGELP